MTEIYLIRHGQASFDKCEYDELSPLGRRQADIVATHLLQQQLQFDRVYSGSLSRQQRTATAYVSRLHAATGNTVALDVEPRLNEFEAEKVIKYYLPYVLEQNPKLMALMQEPGSHQKYFKKYFFAVIEAWYTNRYPNDQVETWLEFKNRVNMAMSNILDTAGHGETIGIFTSGGTIATVMQMALEVPDAMVFQLNYKIANASVTKLMFNKNGLALSYFNNYSHLETTGALVGENIVTYK